MLNYFQFIKLNSIKLLREKCIINQLSKVSQFNNQSIILDWLVLVISLKVLLIELEKALPEHLVRLFLELSVVLLFSLLPTELVRNSFEFH